MLTRNKSTEMSKDAGIGAWASFSHPMKTYPLPLIDTECAAAWGVSIAAMHSKSRLQPIADARQAAMWFAALDDNYLQHIAEHWKCCTSNVRAAIKSADNKMTDRNFSVRCNLVGERLIRQTCNPPETLLRRHD